VTTGRQLIEQAMRAPMQAIGWTPRAAGWFTTPVAPGYTGAVAVGVASKHAEPGSASATLHVHLRREDVQPVVRDLLELTEKDRGYRAPTASTSIGYLMPEPAWREWLVTPETASTVAAELAAATRDYAYPYLQRLTTDPELLVEAVKSSAAMASAGGPCTVAVILARLGRTDEARAYAQQTVAALGARTDPAAQQTRQMADRLRDWVGQLAG
jgi:hypothetical protein